MAKTGSEYNPVAAVFIVTLVLWFVVVQAVVWPTAPWPAALAILLSALPCFRIAGWVVRTSYVKGKDA